MVPRAYEHKSKRRLEAEPNICLTNRREGFQTMDNTAQSDSMERRREKFSRLCALVWCPGNTRTKSGKFLKDGIGSGGPDERARVSVVVVNEFFDPSNQFADAAKAASTDGLLSDEAEPAFDLVKP